MESSKPFLADFEHHPGKGTRRIPLFPELKAVLEEALNLAEKGAVYVVDESMRKAYRGPGGWMNVNLRTTFLKIIKRAGLAQWPRLFHNLRSSRQTELAETFPAHVVCDWLGNSEAVAMKHYLQTTDDHFSRAAGGSPKAKQSRAADDDDAPANPKADARSKAKQKAKQSGAAKARNDSLPETTNPGIADRNESRRLDANTQTDGVGFEPTRRFHVCRFSRSATPLGDSQREQLGKQVRNAPGPSATAPLAFNQDEATEPNRDTTRQIETTHQTSQRQVATCLSRIGSK